MDLSADSSDLDQVYAGELAYLTWFAFPSLMRGRDEWAAKHPDVYAGLAEALFVHESRFNVYFAPILALSA